MKWDTIKSIGIVNWKKINHYSINTSNKRVKERRPAENKSFLFDHQSSTNNEKVNSYIRRKSHVYTTYNMGFNDDSINGIIRPSQQII